ncbi:M14 family metallopeptidase [Halocola ammonii]
MRQLIIIIFAFCFSLLGFTQPNPQPKGITEKFFPDPDVEINTPGFEKKRKFTDYEGMMAYLNERAEKHSDEMSISFIGESQKGKKIPMVHLNRDGGDDKLRVWIQGGLHGNEPASTEGVLFLIDQLLNDPELSYLLDKLEIKIVPMANIDGYLKNNRYAANGLDLNRDQTKLIAQESVFLKQAFSDFNAHVGLDFHEYRAYRRDFTKLSTFGVTNPYDVMFLYSSNLNVPERLRNYTRDRFVADAEVILDLNDLSHHAYFSASTVLGDIHFKQGSLNARSSATSYALANTISTLVEVRGVALGKTSFKRRVYSTFLVGKSYLKTAYQNAEEVKEVLALSARDKGEAVMKTKSRISEQTMTLIDIETEEKIELKVKLREAWHSKAEMSRQRPTAYLILPGNEELVKKLKVLGITLDSLSVSKTIDVEKYKITEYHQVAEKYEGQNRQMTAAKTSKVQKEFPVGTYVLRMDQPRANLAIEVLEPEAPNSFVSFDVLHTEQGAELPVYRYLLNEKF